MKQERISTSQLSVVIAITIMGAEVQSIPRVLASGAENSAWISLLIGWGIGAVGMALFIRLASRFHQDPGRILASSSADGWEAAEFELLCLLDRIVHLEHESLQQTIAIPLLPETPISTTLLCLLCSSSMSLTLACGRLLSLARCL